MNLLLTVVLCILLLLASISDIKKRIIPNVIVSIILLIGILNSVLYHSLFAALFVAKSKLNFFIGAGDIKLLSAIGAWLGWFLNLYVFLLGCVISLLYVFIMLLFFRKRITSVPFAPFLSLATLSLYIVEFTIP